MRKARAKRNFFFRPPNGFVTIDIQTDRQKSACLRALISHLTKFIKILRVTKSTNYRVFHVLADASTKQSVLE